MEGPPHPPSPPLQEYKETAVFLLSSRRPLTSSSSSSRPLSSSSSSGVGGCEGGVGGPHWEDESTSSESKSRYCTIDSHPALDILPLNSHSSLVNMFYWLVIKLTLIWVALFFCIILTECWYSFLNPSKRVFSIKERYIWNIENPFWKRTIMLFFSQADTTYWGLNEMSVTLQFFLKGSFYGVEWPTQLHSASLLQDQLLRSVVLNNSWSTLLQYERAYSKQTENSHHKTKCNFILRHLLFNGQLESCWFFFWTWSCHRSCVKWPMLLKQNTQNIRALGRFITLLRSHVIIPPSQISSVNSWLHFSLILLCFCVFRF